MWIPLLFALRAHAAGAAAVVPGTAWRLDATTPWSDAEVAGLQGFAAEAPAAWTTARVDLSKEPAAELPDDLTTPHVLATPTRGGRRIALGLVDLEPRVEAWLTQHPGGAEGTGGAAVLAVHLLRRQLGHALTHRADGIGHWSRDPAWRRLSGWSLLPWAGPAEERDWSYATPFGKQNAAEDLATFAERAFVPGRLPGESGLHPACRAPSKWRQLQSLLGPLPALAPDAACAPLEDTPLDPDAVESIELVYVRSSAVSPASLAGHTLMAVQYKPDASGVSRRYSYGLQALAEGKDHGLRYAIRGLTGGFSSQVMWEPYDAVATRYTLLEDRDMVRFRLVLDDPQKRALLGRLDELHQSWRRPYLFFTRNCGQLPLELIRSVAPEPNLPPAFSPDALLGYLDRSDLLVPVERAELEDTSITGRAAAAEGLRGKAMARLRARHPERAAELARVFRDIRRSSVVVRQRGYAALTTLGPELGALDPASFADVDLFLAWSDPIELARSPHIEEIALRGDPTLAVLRTAKGANRAAARAAGHDLVRVDPRAALEEAVATRPAAQGSSHTPLRRLEVMPAVRLENGTFTPAISLSTRLYEVRLGEARRFPVAAGLEGTLMELELQAGLTSLGDVRTRWQLAAVRYFRGLHPFANPGWYVNVADVERDRVLVGSGAATWLEAGPAVELVQVANRRFTLALSAGAAFETRWEEPDTAADVQGAFEPALGLPVRLTAWLGSARQALTGLSVAAEWRPTWSAEGWRVTPSSQVEGRVSLGELGGAGIALVAEHRMRARSAALYGPWQPDQELRLGVWVEPH